MTAQVPMTLRGADKPGDAGNLVALAVRAGADKAKALVGLVGKDLTRKSATCCLPRDDA